MRVCISRTVINDLRNADAVASFAVMCIARAAIAQIFCQRPITSADRRFFHSFFTACRPSGLFELRFRGKGCV